MASNKDTTLSYTLSQYSQKLLANLWVAAGGPPDQAQTASAVAMAESGGKTNATDHDANGSTDYGLWQVNSVHGFNPTELLNNALYNARAAVSVYNSSGWGAWTTYTSGAYLQYMNGESAGSTGTTMTGITRPGGQPVGGGSSDVQTLFASYTPGSQYPMDPSPVTNTAEYTGWLQNLYNSTIGPIGQGFSTAAGAISGAVTDIGSFVSWIAWIFSPKNIIRAVEFWLGSITMIFGFVMYMKRYYSQQYSTARRTTRGIKNTAQKLAKKVVEK